MARLTTTIGSFPKPPALHEARRRFAEGEVDGTALREVEEEATRRAVALQEDLGIDLLVDGEMDRADPISSFAERLSGVEIAGWVRVYGDRYVRKPRVIGPVARGAATTVERFRFARGIASRPVKAVVPGPYTLMDGSFDEHYGSRRALALAMAAVVRDEVVDLVGAGASEIQLDEPSAAARPEELGLLRDALRVAVAPLSGRARVWVYLGYADLEATGRDLAALPVDGLLVAGAHAGYLGLERLAAAAPADRSIGVGVVDVLGSEIETDAEIRARIRHVDGIVPADRLWIVPDGGLRALRAPAARAKLSAMVRAARSAPPA